MLAVARPKAEYLIQTGDVTRLVEIRLEDDALRLCGASTPVDHPRALALVEEGAVPSEPFTDARQPAHLVGGPVRHLVAAPIRPVLRVCRRVRRLGPRQPVPHRRGEPGRSSQARAGSSIVGLPAFGLT